MFSGGDQYYLVALIRLPPLGTLGTLGRHFTVVATRLGNRISYIDINARMFLDFSTEPCWLSKFSILLIEGQESQLWVV